MILIVVLELAILELHQLLVFLIVFIHLELDHTKQIVIVNKTLIVYLILVMLQIIYVLLLVILHPQ